MTKVITIYGNNRHDKVTDCRITCRGVVLRDGQILLVHKERVDQWLIPGGGLEEGETLVQCCIREMAEELGLQVQPVDHYLTIHEYYEQWHLISHYFLCDCLGNAEQHLTDREAQDGLKPEWISLEEGIGIFGNYPQVAVVNEKRSGIYLREYTALQSLPGNDH